MALRYVKMCFGSRVRIVLFSALVAFHWLALLTGPAPPSEVVQGVRQGNQTYLRLLHLDHSWGFFAPDPRPGELLQVVIRTSDGQERFFRLSETIGQSHPAWIRYVSLFELKSKSQTISLARNVARQYADLKPTHVRFIRVRQKLVDVREYRAGKRPYQTAQQKTIKGDWIDVR